MFIRFDGPLDFQGFLTNRETSCIYCQNDDD